MVRLHQNDESVLKRAIDHFNNGNLREAIETILHHLKGKSEANLLSKHSKAYLYLGALYRYRGDYEQALKIQKAIATYPHVDQDITVHAMIEQIIIFRMQHDLEQALRCCAIVERLLVNYTSPALPSTINRLKGRFFTSRGLVLQQLGNNERALEDFSKAFDFIISSSSKGPSSKKDQDLIVASLNLYYSHMIIGNTEKSLEYIKLAYARMQTLKKPFAYGMISLFENLTSYNLFVAGSQNEAIEMLSRISSEVVDNFADFRRVFDFFSSIIVQLHDGKIDLEQIRESIREYGDDPLIKAYLPVLLTGAPPPGSGDGDGDIPSARLAD